MLSRKSFSLFNLGAIRACLCTDISVVRLKLLMRPRTFYTKHQKPALIVTTFPRVKHMTWGERVGFFALFSSLPELNVLANLVQAFPRVLFLVEQRRQMLQGLVVLSHDQCPRFRQESSKESQMLRYQQYEDIFVDCSPQNSQVHVQVVSLVE
jgi:hypothetical protein